MSQPQHISEVMHQLVLNNPDDPWAQILRHCPFIQAEMLKKGYMTTDELSQEEIARLENAGLEGFDINDIGRREREDD